MDCFKAHQGRSRESLSQTYPVVEEKDSPQPPQCLPAVALRVGACSFRNNFDCEGELVGCASYRLLEHSLFTVCDWYAALMQR
jgi:hypothetical protein